MTDSFCPSRQSPATCRLLRGFQNRSFRSGSLWRSVGISRGFSWEFACALPSVIAAFDSETRELFRKRKARPPLAEGPSGSWSYASKAAPGPSPRPRFTRRSGLRPSSRRRPSPASLPRSVRRSATERMPGSSGRSTASDILFAGAASDAPRATPAGSESCWRLLWDGREIALREGETIIGRDHLAGIRIPFRKHLPAARAHRGRSERRDARGPRQQERHLSARREDRGAEGSRGRRLHSLRLRRFHSPSRLRGREHGYGNRTLPAGEAASPVPSRRGKRAELLTCPAPTRLSMGAFLRRHSGSAEVDGKLLDPVQPDQLFDV